MKKKGGFIVTAELVLIATVLVIGMLVGLVVVRDAIVAEMEDIASSIGTLDNGLSFNGVTAVGNDSLPYTYGTTWYDTDDFIAGDQQGLGSSLDFTLAPQPGFEGPFNN